MPSKLDELRSILFGAAHERLEELEARVDRPEKRAADVAEVLPQSIEASFSRDSRLIGALRTPLRQCVAESVRENPDEYADALFPVMGPAIRRAVAEAFKGWIQQANQAIEQSLSPRGMRWRFQAWRAGIPFGQYVLQRTLLYRVEHVYLIHSASGLLIGHVQQADVAAKDEDAVSAMFTAIQEFVKDSFSGAEPRRLGTAELGELTLWAVHGPSCILVAVIQGAPPTTLRSDLEAALERIETQHSRALRDYDGDREAMSSVQAELQPCLLSSSREPERAARPARLSPALATALLVGVALLGWFAYGLWLDARVARVAASLDRAAGIVVTSLERDRSRLLVRGLRDPMAAAVDVLAAEAGWRGTLDADFKPFLSLESEMILARATERLRPPAGVVLRLQDDRLVLSGVADAEWIEAARNATVNGVAGLDLDAVEIDAQALLNKLRELLDIPAGVTLSYDDGRLVAVGEAAQDFHERLSVAPDLVPGISSVNTADLVVSERRRLETLANAVAQVTVGFGAEAAALGSELAKLDELAGDLSEYGQLAQLFGMQPRILVTGRSAATGPDGLNRRLERGRAEAVRAELVARGLPAGWFVVRSQLEDGMTGRRAAEVAIQLELDRVTSGN